MYTFSKRCHIGVRWDVPNTFKCILLFSDRTSNVSDWYNSACGMSNSINAMSNSVQVPYLTNSVEHEKKIARRNRKKKYRKERRQNNLSSTMAKLNLDMTLVPDFFRPIPSLDMIDTVSNEALNIKKDCLEKGNLTQLHSRLVHRSNYFMDNSEKLEHLSEEISSPFSHSAFHAENREHAHTAFSCPNAILQNKGFRNPTETVEACSRMLTKSFWGKVPNICTPNSDLTADERIVSINKNNERKYYKKLLAKLKSGDITEEEMQLKLIKNGKAFDLSNDAELTNNVSDLEKLSGTPIDDVDNKKLDIPLMTGDRAFKKCLQIENFASIFEIFGRKKCVIDFGSGSGNLCLVFAAIFPETKFVFCDMKEESLKILQNRADKAGLKNVVIFQHAFSPLNAVEDTKLLKQQYPDFDLGIGLHSCGNFTDLIMDICLNCNADCVVCPCCNGKIARFIEKGPGLVEKTKENSAKFPADDICDKLSYKYPRSNVFQGKIDQEEYCIISKAADDEFNYLAKCYIELDRGFWALEQGFEVTLLRMNPLISSPKHHIIYAKRTRDKL